MPAMVIPPHTSQLLLQRACLARTSLSASFLFLSRRSVTTSRRCGTRSRAFSTRLSQNTACALLPPPPPAATAAAVAIRVGRNRSLDGLVAASAVSGVLLLGYILGQEEETAGEVRCQSASSRPAAVDSEASKMSEIISSEREELRDVALAYLTESMAAHEAARRDVEEQGLDVSSSSSSSNSSSNNVPELLQLGVGGDLPANIYDLDAVLEKTPLLRDDNAFHDTLNTNDTISCPFVLNRPGQKGEGMEAVVRFGKSIAGHPKVVHGGITALTFDNLLGMALFLHGTGAVFTAYIKVDYKALLPCLTTAVVDVTIDRKEGRKLFVTGRLKSLDRTVLYASAEALFIKPRDPSPPAPPPPPQAFRAEGEGDGEKTEDT